MLEFEDFVYLDVQKTGSTKIRAFLRKFARGEVVLDRKHRPVDLRDENKLYIISCRDPLKLYLSLYTHGYSGEGSLRKYFTVRGRSDIYGGTNENFEEWLTILLDPLNGREYLKGIDNNGILEFAGLMTLRFLRLAFASPLEVFETLHNKTDVRERLKTGALYRVTLKNETLTDDLKKLVTGEYSRLFRRPARAEKALDQDRRKNVSTNPGIDLTTLSRGIVSRVQEREWLYFDELGYPPYLS